MTPKVVATTPRVQPTSRPVLARQATPQRQRPRPVAPRPKATQKLKPKQKQQHEVVKALPVARDPVLAPRVLYEPTADVLERGRLLLAGGALVVVALGGAVVLVASRRALAGAHV